VDNSGLFMRKYADVSAGISNLTYVYQAKSVWHKDSREKLNTAICDTALTVE